MNDGLIGVKTIVKLCITNGVVILLGILSGVVAARQYGPEQIGKVSIYLILVTIASYLVGGRYDYAFFRKDKTFKISNQQVVCSSIMYAIIVTLLISSIVIPFIIVLLNVGYLSDLEHWIFLAPVSIIVSVTWMSFQSFINFEGDYNKINSSKKINSMLAFIFIAILAVLNVEGGIVIGGLLAQVIAIIYIYKKISLNINVYKINLEEFKNFLIEYKDHPLKLAPTWVLNIIAQQAPIFIIGIAYSPVQVGLYTIANKAAYAPVQLVANSVGDVLREKISNRKNNNLNRDSLINLMIKLVTLSLPIYIFLNFFATQIITYILGEKWIGIQEIMTYILILGWFQFCFTPFDKIAIAYGKSKYMLIWNMTRFTSIIIVTLLCQYNNASFDKFIIAFISVNCILYVYDYIFGLKTVNEKR
jgi:O-antigen/teichoic acid export membrane protein